MDLRGRRAVTAVFILCLIPASLHAAEVHGTVKMDPPYPETKVIQVKKKVQDSCASEQISQALLVSKDGGVANAVIWLEGDFGPQTASVETVVLNQTRCNFDPHVLLVPPGGRIEVRNSDPLAHDVRSFDASQMLFRFEMDKDAKPEVKDYKSPGIYTLRCGLHPWMHGFVIQAAHRFYAVSDSGGQFTLKDVPEGSYKVKIWHETLGEKEASLEVKKGTNGFNTQFPHSAAA